jgi:hypothetical protein
MEEKSRGRSKIPWQVTPRQPPLPNPPNWAKLKLGVSLKLDKSWEQRQQK